MDMFRGVKHRLGDTYRSVVSTITPQGTESRFVENGTLTPEEFVEAGDQLIFKFPTWQWAQGDPSRGSSYLPKDKQFLITKDVPCRDRVRALDYVLRHKTRVEDEWLLPESANDSRNAGEVRDMDDIAKDFEQESGAASSGGFGGPIIVAQEDFLTDSKASAADGDHTDGLPNFSDLDGALEENDPACQATAAAAPAASATSGAGDMVVVRDDPESHIVRSRTYDLSITYDKYYQTPRLWLFGYDEGHTPLQPDQVYEDVLSDYVSRTVTVDPHPLSGTPTVSIHPCKHAQVMKKVVQDWIEQGIIPRHDLALFVFLKFISGVVPTINYDFTMDIEF
eukprot:TRINITY_DN56883_c0_g1_i1.p1 TRINITY_DN56883_c0_g1~~TRINITY_DN56883_c0_g1_i1.p1  ORF type:complete len:337 (+),score=48.09 TRINITY_DN56883_c0_g1_i1:127-1137(+)